MIKKKYSGKNSERRAVDFTRRYLKLFVRSFKFRKFRGKHKNKKLVSLYLNDEKYSPFLNTPNFIMCRDCKKLSKSFKSYLRTCNKCRNHYHKHNVAFVCLWASWGD